MGLLGAACASLAGCASPFGAGSMQMTAKDRDCLTRAMYFESQRNSEEGLLAVGTVVMNRVDSEEYPNTVCGVVGQRRQFAHGVLTRKMDPAQAVMAEKVAGDVMAGKRSAAVGKAKYFHAARIRIPYKNTNYVTVAGGNAFYEKRKGGGRQLPPLEPPVTATAKAETAEETKTAEAETPKEGKPPFEVKSAQNEVPPVPAEASPPPIATSYTGAVQDSSQSSQIQKSSFGAFGW